MPIGTTPVICLLNNSDEVTYSRRGSNQYQGAAITASEVTQQYHCHNFASRIDAANAFIASVGDFVPDNPELTRDTIRIQLIYDQDENSLLNTYLATCTWTRDRPEDKEDGEYFSGNVSLETRTIQKAWNQRFRGVNAAAPPREDAGVNINVSKDGIAGTDATVGVINFELRRYYQKGTVANLPTIAGLVDYVGFPNFFNWRNFGDGEVTIQGVDVSNQDAEYDIITYTMEARKTVASVTFDTAYGPVTLGPIRGYDYVWFQDVEFNGAGGEIVHGTHSVYVVELLEPVDINQVIP